MKKRFLLLRESQRLVYDAEKAAPEQNRVCWCHRGALNKVDKLPAYRTETSGRVGGLVTCGSVWLCPVCAAQIAEKRRAELNAAMVECVGQGGTAYLLTLTFPHQAEQPLAELIEKQQSALTKFKNSKTFKKEMKAAGRLGSVRALEVTVGTANGWHPHTHDLVFVDNRRGFDACAIDRLRLAWVKTLLKCQLGSNAQVTDMMEHALDLRGGEYAAEYIAKYGRDSQWGMSGEVTRQAAKVGGAGEINGDMHFTPFQLLEWSANGDDWAAARWKEYAEVMQGKRMLSWSPGLKKALRVKEITDEELAAAPLPDETLAGHIDHEQLSLLVSRDAMPDFKVYLADNCANAETAQQDIDDFFAALRKRKRFRRGLVKVRNYMTGAWQTSEAAL